jgi:hypothetical protein
MNPHLMVLKPEIQLLYKSRSKRPKDLQDLENCLRKFDSRQKDLLRDWIITDSGKGHLRISTLFDGGWRCFGSRYLMEAV